jgi:hypothetical protein
VSICFAEHFIASQANVSFRPRSRKLFARPLFLPYCYPTMNVFVGSVSYPGDRWRMLSRCNRSRYVQARATGSTCGPFNQTA